MQIYVNKSQESLCQNIMTSGLVSLTTNQNWRTSDTWWKTHETEAVTLMDRRNAVRIATSQLDGLDIMKFIKRCLYKLGNTSRIINNRTAVTTAHIQW